MRSFSTHDLNKLVGEVTDAAVKATVMITRHRKPRLVMMSIEHYQRISASHYPRRSYGAGETPRELLELLRGGLERVAKGEGYDDEP